MKEISSLFILMEVEIITQKLSDKREDSFWYWDKDIAKIQLENNHNLLLSVSGNVKYLEHDKKYKNKEAIDLFLSEEYNYDDRDLDDLIISGDIPESNHFTIIELNESNKVVGDCLGICHEYEEAIEMLKELAFLDQK